MTLIDREFPSFARGEIRETILEAFRASLRELGVDDITIRRATSVKARDWVEADSIDLIGQAIQRRGDFLAQQVNPERAASPFLYNFHSRLSGLEPLAAQGAAGFVLAQGEPGTVYIGSTVVPDSIATQALDEAGKRYQVFISGAVPGGGSEVLLALKAVDTGRETNLEVGTELTWSNRPMGSAPTAFVTGEAFRGGIPKETDQEFIRRLMDVRRSRPKAGNPSHVRFWGRTASNAVDDVFVYPCALNSGSMLVSVLQKRTGAVGPLARQPTFATLALVTGYLVPPTAPELPGDPHVVVTGFNGEVCSMTIRLGMRYATESGWHDQSPWPTYSGAPVTVATGPSQTIFRIDVGTAVPSGVTSPALMIWNDTTSEFEELPPVSSVVLTTPPNTYTVTLSAPHTGKTITEGDYISPDTERRADISQAVRDYFDSLGPGEVVGATDVRIARAFRRVEPEIRSSYFAGSRVVEYVREQLGFSLVREELTALTATAPSVPASVSLGPAMLVPGKIAVYALL
jgi:hypothetical protein